MIFNDIVINEYCYYHGFDVETVCFRWVIRYTTTETKRFILDLQGMMLSIMLRINDLNVICYILETQSLAILHKILMLLFRRLNKRPEVLYHPPP